MTNFGGKSGGPTLASIAEKVGVSINTVSRAMRAPQTVRPELRQAITRAMDELNYVPNRLAGGLSGQRSDLVALIMPGLADTDFAEIADVLQARLATHGLSVMLTTTGDATGDEETAIIRSALSWRPAAVAIAARDRSDKVMALLASAGVPVVDLWEAGDLSVGLDHASVGRAQADYLIARGFRRLAFLGGLTETDRATRRRIEGATAAVEEGGFAALVTMTKAQADQPALGTGLLWQLLARQPDVDGIITSSDRVGFGVIAGLATLKREAGKAIGIIGFGDDPASAYLTPALTSIRPDRQAIAEKAADLIVARISGEPGVSSVAGWELIARGT